MKFIAGQATYLVFVFQNAIKNKRKYKSLVSNIII